MERSRLGCLLFLIIYRSMKDPNQTTLSTEKRLTSVEKDVQYMRESLVRIESNHLVHINDELRDMNKKVGDLTTNFTTELGKLYEEITKLKITDAGREPGATLFWEIVKVIIMALVAAVIGVVVGGRI